MGQHGCAAFICLIILAVAGCGASMHSQPSTDNGAGTVHIEPGESSKSVQQRLVLRADVDLVVSNFDPLPERVDAAVKAHHGFVANSNISGSQGYPRHGRWTFRLPVDEYSQFLKTVCQLGDLRSINSTSDDVTAEYTDVDSRVRNKQKEEERLLKLLADATGRLDEILTVERELSRVRGEIEQAQGRLRVLANITELTTVTLLITEIKNYVPVQAPAYLTRVRQTFDDSLANLLSVGQELSLMIVALAPWLPVCLFVCLFSIVGRRMWRKRPKSA